MKTRIQNLCFIALSMVLAMPVYAANPPIDWQLDHTTVVTSPKDRKRTKVGVGEKVDLKAPCPADWTIQGGGVLSTATSATTQFTAPETAAQVIITAKLHVDNSTKTVTFNVVEPSGITFVKTANITNNSNTLLQAGFQAAVYITPSDVNFTAISVGENAAPAITTGHYTSLYPNGFNHPPKGAVRLTTHVQGRGSINPLARDTVDTGLIPRFGNPAKYTAGTFLWKIPWRYELGQTNKVFTTANQKDELTTNNANQTASVKISKGAVTSNTDTVNQ